MPSRLAARLLRLAAISLTVLLITLLAVLASLSAVLSTPAGTNWVLGKVSAALQSDGRTLQFSQSQGTLLSGVTLRNFHYQEGDNSAHIDTVRSRWSPFSLFSGALSLQLLEIDGLVLDWQSDNAVPAPNARSNPLDTLLPLPVNVSVDVFILENARIRLDGQETDIESLHLSASLRQHALRIEDMTLSTELGSLLVELQGQLQIDLSAAMATQATLAWTVNGVLLEGIENAAGTLNLSGDMNTLTLNHELNHPLPMHSSGTLLLNLLANSIATTPSFDLQHTLSPQALPGLQGDAGERVFIESAQISTTGWIDALELRGVATLQPRDSTDAPITPLINLSWETILTGTQLLIEQLSLSTLSGNFSSTGAVDWGDDLALSLDYSLREQNGSLYQSLLPEGLIPGTLTSSGSLALNQESEAWQGHINIDALEGTLNDYLLSGAGSIVFTEEAYEFNAIHLSSGTSTLQLDGHWADTVNLQWQLHSPDLSNFSSALAGELEVNGNVSGDRQSPQLTLDARGLNLQLGNSHIESLSASGQYLDGDNLVHVLAQNLQLDVTQDSAQTVERIEINARGQIGEHSMTVAASSSLGSVELTLDGGIADLGTMRWNGMLARGLTRSDLGDWSLDTPVTMSLSQQELTLARHCWQQEDSTLCITADWRDSGALELAINLRDYPMSVFNGATPAANGSVALLPRLPVSTSAEGSINADFTANGILSNDPSELALRFNANAGQGMISVATNNLTNSIDVELEPTTQNFYWSAAVVNGNRTANGWLLNTSLDFYQPDLAATGMEMQGNVRGQLSIATDERLDGQLNLSLADLGWLAAFLPAIENIQGQVEGTANIQGSLNAPLIRGNLNLLEAGFEVPVLGLEIHNIDITASSDNSQNVTINGSANSGNGNLRFNTQIRSPMSAERSITVALQGDTFSLAETAQLRIAISPDLNARMDSSGIDITGILSLPLLDVRIISLPESALDVSADTVLVAQPDAGPEVRNAARVDRGILSDLPITAALQLRFGEEVSFSGFGLNTKLTGALDITQRATGAPLAYGELNIVEGDYQTYGRTLIIEHGKLLFFGSYDNPALDIRAVRQAENVKVGVQMNGTLRNIRSQLFSTPTLPDGDIIAVMLTGRPFAEMGEQDNNALIGAITNLGINQSQSLTNQIRNELGLDTLALSSGGDVNNSSLTLGKYLTPRIFIRYGVGLFETESTLTIDYTVSERVKLEAKSGSTQSVDITYTVER